MMRPGSRHDEPIRLQRLADQKSGNILFDLWIARRSGVRVLDLPILLKVKVMFVAMGTAAAFANPFII